MEEPILMIRLGMKNISDIEKRILKYVASSVPQKLPIISEYVAAFIQSLLSSSMITDALDELDATSICSYNSDHGPESAMNFILRDYCSVVGVGFRSDSVLDYREPIVRCLVRKDENFYRWLANYCFGEGVFVIFPEGGYLSKDVYATDTNDLSGKVATTDSGLYTDMQARSIPVITINFSTKTEEEASVFIGDYLDLLLLVLPARLPVVFTYKDS